MSKKHKQTKNPPRSVKALLWDPELDRALMLLKPGGKGLEPDLPGGSPERKENAIQTLTREVLEETGIKLPKKGLSQESSNTHMLYVQEVALAGLELELSPEHHGAMLVPLAELPRWFKGTHWHDLVRTAVQSVERQSASVAA